MKRSAYVFVLAIMSFTFLTGCSDKEIFSTQVTINNLNFPNDNKIMIAIYKYPAVDVYNNLTYEAQGEGYVKNGSVSIELNKFNDEITWKPSGSWYIILSIQDNIDLYITKNNVNFNSKSQHILDFSFFRQMVYAYLITDLYNTKIIGSSDITLDELILTISYGEVNYSEMMEGYSFLFYKDSDLTQTFNGNDIVNIKTILYTDYFIFFSGGSDG